MSLHIHNDQTARASAVICPDQKCNICCQIGTLEVTYVGVYCNTCKKMNSAEFRGHVVRYRRELLNVSRRKMSELTGYSQSTIRRYETDYCPDSYWFLTENLMKDKYGT